MMRPIMMKGHERPLTQVKYNREGDLLLSVSKDKEASIWYSSNGERLGTLEGHEGTIWSIDVDSETHYFVTGSADFTVKLWKAETGENVKTWGFKSPVKRVEFNHPGDKVALITDQVMGQKAAVKVIKINQQNETEQQDEPILEIVNEEDPKNKYSVVGWSYGDLYLIVGHANGKVSKFDAKTGELLKSVEVHESLITDIQFSEDRTYFITSSKDKSAKVLDVDNLEILKKFSADAPMNSACITPVKEFVILGGGQDARDVTTTSSSEGKFEARFFHKIFEDEIGRVKGHFGPLNYVAVHPKGTSYTSGGEDGYIRLHHFHKSYFEYYYDVEKTTETVSNQKEIEA